MPENFNWQTEEEREEIWQEAEPAGQSSRAAHRWWLVIVLVVLVAGAVYGGYRASQQRVAEAEALTAEDVLASHRLAQTAAEAGDRELLATVLSGREQRWTQTQFRLLEEGLLFEDAPQAIDLHTLEEPGAVVDVSFSPDLREAEVVSDQRVAREPGDEAVTLRQVHVYRRGDQGWLLSPPQAEFWGPWRVWQGQHLTLHHSERDAPLAERLAGDLDRMLGQMCDTLHGLECPRDLRVRVRLDRDPSSVALAARSQVSTMAAGELTLPSPTLIGAPADDAAYATLYPAYARRVVSAVVSDLVGYRCCEQIVFFRAALDWQLAQLGLQPWPLTLEHYLQVAQELDGPGQLERLWSLSELPQDEWPERWHAYSLIELLVRQGEDSVNAALLQRRLGAASTAMRWITIISQHDSMNSLEVAWRGYVIERANEWLAAPPPPEQELVLACRYDNRAGIWRYSPAQERWRRGLPGLDLEAGVVLNGVVGLPDGSGLLVSTWEEPATQAALWHWQPDGVQRLETAGTAFELQPGDQSGRNMDPLGRYTGVWARNRENGDSGHALLDLASCASGDCAWEALGGWPIWSPDGRHVLYTLHDNAILQSAIMRRPRDALAPRQVAYGFQPFWLNNQIFGYLAGGALQLAAVPDGEGRPAFALEDLYSQVVSDGNVTRHFAVEHLLAAPGRDGTLLLFLRDHGGGQSYVLRLQGMEGQSWLDAPPMETVEVLLQTPDVVFGPPLASVSPNGRWLTLHTFGQGSGRILIYDLESGDVAMSSATSAGRKVTAAWSGDGNWLARLSGSYIELVAPEHGPYRRPLLPLSESSQTTPVCTDLAWVNPQ